MSKTDEDTVVMKHFSSLKYWTIVTPMSLGFNFQLLSSYIEVFIFIKLAFLWLENQSFYLFTVEDIIVDDITSIGHIYLHI